MVPTVAIGNGAIHQGTTRTTENRPLPSSPHSSKNGPSSGNRRSNRQHETILFLREELCKLVVGLSTLPSENTAPKTPLLLSLSLENVAETLDPFFASIVPSIEKNYYETKDSSEALLFRGITPLVIACDRGNLACLLYFCQLLERKFSLHGIFWEALIGSPLKSRTVPDETTAFHHCTTELAIQAEHQRRCDGGESLLELLERISIAQESLSSSDESTTSSNSSSSKKKNIVLELGEAVNCHGDTPLMMAAANNLSLEGARTSSAKDFLERWHTLALKRCNPEQEQLQKQQIGRALIAKNDLGRTIISYAWAGGIVDLVQWLVDIDDKSALSAPIITSQDTLGFRKSMALLEKSNTKNINNAEKPDTTKTHEKQRYVATEECIRLLEAHVEKRSEQMAKQLLEELEGDGNHSENPKQKKSKRKKKKKKEQQQELKLKLQQLPSEVVESCNGEDLVEDTSQKELISGTNTIGMADREIGSNPDRTTGDVICLTKLSNGRLAVKVPGHHQQEENPREENSSLLPLAWYRKRTFSLDETNQLLRDRYKEGNTNLSSSALSENHGKEGSAETAPATIPTMSKELNQSSDADAVLSALCLDVNCLLYSDHGMALNLSAAQLDAVEQILGEQLQSVAKARLLQERRCKGTAAHSSLVTSSAKD